jgi:hypothetical protein
MPPHRISGAPRAGDRLPGTQWNRLVAVTVQAATGLHQIPSLSADVAWLVHDALDGPEAGWEGSILAMSTMVSELN